MSGRHMEPAEAQSLAAFIRVSSGQEVRIVREHAGYSLIIDGTHAIGSWEEWRIWELERAVEELKNRGRDLEARVEDLEEGRKP